MQRLINKSIKIAIITDICIRMWWLSVYYTWMYNEILDYFGSQKFGWYFSSCMFSLMATNKNMKMTKRPKMMKLTKWRQNDKNHVLLIPVTLNKKLM